MKKPSTVELLTAALSAVVGVVVASMCAISCTRTCTGAPQWVRDVDERTRARTAAREARDAEWNRRLEINRNKVEPEKEGDEE